MSRLEAMSLVIAVAETGSISAASRRLKWSMATASRNVTEFESRLNAQLFQRTSRWMTLTDATRSCIEVFRRIIEQADDAPSGGLSGDACQKANWPRPRHGG